jgi:hypothetical protein
MFYDAVANTHGLAVDPFKALVAPRPIGWISTLGKNGVVNLAPYSFFNAVSEDPHFVMFASGGHKDSCPTWLWRLRGDRPGVHPAAAGCTQSVTGSPMGRTGTLIDFTTA